MEWIFWVGLLLYLIIGEAIERKWRTIKEKRLKITKILNRSKIVNNHEENKILIQEIGIFFFWPLFLIYWLLFLIYIIIYNFLYKEVV